MSGAELISAAVRDVPDFPKKGIIFKDITPVLQDAYLFNQAIDEMAAPWKNTSIDAIASVEARGFIFGAALAGRLRTGLILVRKKGKLPYRTVQQTYNLEYGTDTLEVHEDAVSPGDRILLVDDLLATGGTVAATIQLLKKLNATVMGLSVLIELGFLNGRQKLPDCEVRSVITY